MNLKIFILPSLPPFFCRKEWKACSNFWECWVLSRWRNTRIQAARIQNHGHFRHFNMICSNFPTLPTPRGVHVDVQSLHLIPCPPTSGITSIAALAKAGCLQLEIIYANKLFTLIRWTWGQLQWYYTLYINIARYICGPVILNFALPFYNLWRKNAWTDQCMVSL